MSDGRISNSQFSQDDGKNAISIENQAMQSVLGQVPAPTDLHCIGQVVDEMKAFTSKCYINRDLSTLRFQLRVLAQATNPRYPLLERMFFLTIFSSNMDEFFEIRVAGLIQKMKNGDVSSSLDGRKPSELLDEISQVAHRAVEEQYRILNDHILPELATHDIRYLKRHELTPAQKAWMKTYFFEQVMPVLTPISIDPAHPFPRLVNKSLNFIVSLEGKDAFGRDLSLAIVPAPRSLPRVIRLPDELTDGKEHHIMLSAVIHEHVGELFLGMKVKGCHQFRLTRNADLDLSDDVDDIAKALEGELGNRRFGDKVRLEVTTNCPKELYELLLKEFGLNESQLYRVNGPVNLTRMLTSFDKPELKFTPFNHATPKVFLGKESMFDVIGRSDVLVHHPFSAFNPVVNMLWQAGTDPDVLAIKQTIYRSGVNSDIVKALAQAARNGKEVTAVIELRARFDEESNIAVANMLQDAGAIVVYGVVGYKTHAKLMLIVRRENGKIRRYAHLGTGNYHAGNAKAYTDYGLFTAHEEMCADVAGVFGQLTGMGRPLPSRQIMHAPFTLHDGLVALIDQEIRHAQAGKKARIILKCNAVTERGIINKLYEASQAGVEIDLIVRSICCLRPQVKGLSENIKVRSIVGRFLEHTRVYYFYNDGDEKLYCSSADLMDRNLLHRVEVAYPILDKALFAQIYEDGLINYLSDNVQAWELDGRGEWHQATQGKTIHDAQAILLDKICGEVR
ncbi:MAG: polyphosphate kinase 1 [Moraxella sp.]|uniref:polyphosphate kinase 1 n=1 Tax=Moraxella sp. TaxID=479 RepID=UPI0026DDBAE8|nr:polyphosphate kinase 1 [Moraxella sp.]MDO4450442.1 polyphosphate kinase 1 [Moraxella sp.]